MTCHILQISRVHWIGFSVAISDEYAVIGATRDNENGSRAGSAYVFKRDGTIWNEEAKLIASDGARKDQFGCSVSISGDYAVIGAYLEDSRYGSGSAYVFRRVGTTWTEDAKLVASDWSDSDWFGRAVAISGDYVVSGADGDDDNGSWAGSAYVYSGIPAQPDASVLLTLSSASGNGTFDYFIDLANNTGVSNTIDIWVEITGPGGHLRTALVVSDMTIAAYRTYLLSNDISLSENTPLGDYEVTVSAGDYPGLVISSSSSTYTKTGIGKAEGLMSVPTTTSLLGNYPNPFNPSTTISYALPEKTHVKLEVCDMLGQVVATIVNENQLAGSHSAVWDGENETGSDVASGVYLYRLTAGGIVETRRMLLIK